MSYSGPTHQVGTFSGRVDDLHTGGILQVVYTGDRMVAWSSSLHSIRSGSSVYGSVLEEFPEGHGDTAVDELPLFILRRMVNQSGLFRF